MDSSSPNLVSVYQGANLERRPWALKLLPSHRQALQGDAALPPSSSEP